MKAFICWFMTLFLVLSCSTSKLNYSKIDSVTLSRSGCFGKCPIYSTTFFSDNTVSYKGKMFVDLVGEFSAESPKDFSEIQALLQQVDFFNLKDSYVDTNIVDVPTYTLIVKQGKLIKKIVENGDAPYEVKRIGAYLDKQISKIEATNWSKIN